LTVGIPVAITFSVSVVGGVGGAIIGAGVGVVSVVGREGFR
jgi:hypothetical protein